MTVLELITKLQSIENQQIQVTIKVGSSYGANYANHIVECKFKLNPNHTRESYPCNLILPDYQDPELDSILVLT